MSTKTTATVLGVPESSDYRCEVAAVGAEGQGPWSAATAATLVAPPAPAKPAVGPLDGAVQVTVPAVDPTLVSGYHYECSADGGATWVATADTATPDGTTAQVPDLTNGTEYVCRAFANGAAGRSEASPDVGCGQAVRVGIRVHAGPRAGRRRPGRAGAGGSGFPRPAFLRSRQRGYVVAVVDVVHTANLGHGSNLGIRFVKDPGTRRLTGLVADRGPEADIKIRHLGRDRFEIQDRLGKRTATSGEAIITADSTGARHELVLRAFDTKAASQVTSQV